MRVNKRLVYTILYDDNTKYIAKNLKDICIHYTQHIKDKISYDKFRYMYINDKIYNLTKIQKIECYDFYEYMKPQLDIIRSANSVKYENCRDQLTPYIINKVFDRVQKQYISV